MSAVNRIEVQAKTVEEAVRLALAQLNRRQEEVQIEVLREPTGGIFGFGAEDAVVRVTVLNPAEEAVEEEYEDELEYEDEEDEYYEEPAIVGTDDEAVRELEQVSQRTLEQLLDKMNIPAHVSIRDRRQLYLADDDPPTTALDVQGRNLGVLIGRKGETLLALQYVLNLMVNKQLGQWTRVLVDVEGYRRRREESLENLAQRVAYRVAQSRRSITLEPMPPNERRVIHMVLRDNPDVITESTGEEPGRKVTIVPRMQRR